MFWEIYYPFKTFYFLYSSLEQILSFEKINAFDGHTKKSFLNLFQQHFIVSSTNPKRKFYANSSVQIT
jgi:hypothetical protein